MTRSPSSPVDDRIVGFDLPDQRRVRRTEPIRDLREFLDFLDDVEALFGPIPRPSPRRPSGPLRL